MSCFSLCLRDDLIMLLSRRLRDHPVYSGHIIQIFLVESLEHIPFLSLLQKDREDDPKKNGNKVHIGVAGNEQCTGAGEQDRRVNGIPYPGIDAFRTKSAGLYIIVNSDAEHGLPVDDQAGQDQYTADADISVSESIAFRDTGIKDPFIPKQDRCNGKGDGDQPEDRSDAPG